MILHQKVNLTGNDYYTIYTINNLTFGAHFHHAIEICYLMDGECEFTVDGKIYLLSKGDAIISMPNQIHSVKTPVSSRIKMIRIWPGVAGTFFTEYKHKIPKSSKFKVTNDYFVKMDIIPIPNLYMVKSVVYLLLSNLCTQCDEWLDTTAEESIIEEMLKIAEAEFTEDITLKDLSKRLNYNYAYLSRKFSQTIGMTFNEYLNNCRINHSCWMLKNTDLTITEISTAAGYTSIRSFNRNFVKYNHSTPQQFRNSPN